jgi:hypothetical protein
MSTVVIINKNTDEVLHVQGWEKPFPKQIFIDAHVARTGDDPNDIDVLYDVDDYSWGQWVEAYYVTGNAITPRPSMSLTVSATTILIGETATISNIPLDADVYLDGVHSGNVNSSGEVNISSDVLRHFHLRFEKFPYLDEEVSIYVT